MTETVCSKPKLIFVTHEFAPFRGGVATYVEEVARTIHRRGDAVEIWAPDFGKSHMQENGCPVVRSRAGGSLRWNHLTQLTRELRARRAEWQESTVVLASVGAHMAFMRLAAWRRLGSANIISLLHGSEVLRFERNLLWRWLAPRLYRDVQRIVTVSEFSRGLIEQSFLRRFAGKFQIAPCGCSSAAMREVPTKKHADGKLRILTLARIHPRKGQLDVAKALAGLPKELRERVIYQIAGTGDVGYLLKVAEACGNAGVKLENLGEVAPEKLAEVYAQCDIFAMTSRRLPRSVEGFGIAYLDAAFHSKPVVAYRSGGTAEAVRNDETGLLVDEGDVNALTDAFARLLTHAPLRERLGNAGRKHAEQKTWGAAAEVFLREI